MKLLIGLLAVSSLVACGDSGPSQQDSFQAFGAATAAMSSAQSRAIQAAQAVAPADLVLNFEGACQTGGAVKVLGNYSGTGGQSAVFDLATTFTDCADAQGALDGALTWTSVAEGTKYTATMKGDIDWQGAQASAGCDFNVTVSVDGQAVTYGGSVCGYDIATGR
jgi:hypothetical protein